MANKKITQLNDIGTSIDSDDLLHIIDDPAGTPINKKVSIGNLFANIPGLLSLKQAPETIAAGAISTETVITNIATDSMGGAFSLANGVEGQLKIIIMTQDDGDATITPLNLLGAYNTIRMDSVGESITLLFSGNSWVVISAGAHNSNNGATVEIA